MRLKLRLRTVKSWSLVGLVLLLLVGSRIRQIYLRGNTPPYNGPRWRRDQEERAFEAVFRYQIREHQHDQQVCFLRVRTTAPEPALMRRFANLPFVLPVSPRFQSGANGYMDRTTGHAALHFWIDQIEWDSDTEVRVAGGGGAAGMSGNAGEFVVLWRHGEWQAVRYEQKVIF